MTHQNYQGINFKDSNPTISNNTFNFEAAKQNPPNNVQFTGSTNFVGRKHELTLLRDRLQQKGAVVISAVAGMGGVGKTELVIQYIKQHEADYPGGICWLSARDSDLAASIVQFAQLHMNWEVPQQDFRGNPFNLTQQVEWCWQHWKPEGLALIILDDVTSIASCRDFLPKANRFRVLMTTRVRNLDPKIEEISLGVLSPEEALKLLTGLVGEKRIKKELEVANQLCEWLGYLPLGLELVGRYVVEDPDLFLAEVLRRLENQSLLDEAVNPSQEQLMTAKRGVKAAFELSWVELDSKTQDVGRLLSLFALDVIPWKLVDNTSQLLSWAESDVIKARKQLYKRHLIENVTEKENCYRIHHLIREFLQNKFAESETGGFFAWIRDVFKTKKRLRPKITSQLKSAFAAAMVAIAKKIPSSLTVELINSVKDAIPHLAEVAQNLIDAVSDENLTWVVFGLGHFYQEQGLYELAEPYYQQCLLITREKLGEDNPNFPSSINNLARLYYNQGRYREAEPLFKQALALRKHHLGEDNPDFAQSLNHLAGLYNSQGRYAEAEPLFKQALALRKHHLGEDNPDFASSLNDLAGLYLTQRRYAEAEPLFKQALATRRLLGEDNLDFAQSLNHLAGLYNSQGRYAEAEPLFKQALALTRRLLGEENRDFAQSLNHLAVLYFTQGQYGEAEPLFKQALALTRRLLGEEHPLVAMILNNLARLYHNQDRHAEAKPLYHQALESASKTLGVDHPTTISIRENLKSLRDNYAKIGSQTDEMQRQSQSPTPQQEKKSIRGDDLRFDLKLSFQEAAVGVEKEIRISHLDNCDACKEPGFRRNSWNRCSACNGEKPIQITKKLKISIPAGVDNGTRLRISQEGDAGGNGGTAGDLYVYLFVDEDDELKRSNGDILSTLEITKSQAAAGCKMDIRTINGSVCLTIPPGTKNGITLRLRNRGVPRRGDPSIRGNHLVTILVK